MMQDASNVRIFVDISNIKVVNNLDYFFALQRLRREMPPTFTDDQDRQAIYPRNAWLAAFSPQYGPSAFFGDVYRAFINTNDVTQFPKVTLAIIGYLQPYQIQFGELHIIFRGVVHSWQKTGCS
jgi:hypothetical protein